MTLPYSWGIADLATMATFDPAGIGSLGFGQQARQRGLARATRRSTNTRERR